MAMDAAKKAQQARAKKYGIGIKPGGNVTKPADYADVADDLFADPVNYRYPLSPANRAVNAVTRYNDASNKAAGGYSDAEWAKMGQRIAKANKGKKYEGGQIVNAKEAKMDGNRSLDEQVRKVRDAFEAQFRVRSMGGEYPSRWVNEVYADKVIADWGEGVYYSIPYQVEENEVKFAEPEQWVKVERTWKALSEALRILAARKKKGEEEAEGREWEVVIIGPEADSDVITEGQETFIRSKNGRLYKTSALEASVSLWDGIKVYDNHLTDEEMAAKQGMRSVVQEWVGVIVQPAWDAAKKAVTGVLKVVDDTLRAKLVNAEKAGVLDKIGLSIDALGEGQEAQIGGSMMTVVEKITQALSVDVVADPAAGGRLARLIAGMSPLGAVPRGGDRDIPIEEDEMDPEELQRLISEAVSAALAGANERIAALEAKLAEAGGEEEPEEEETPEADPEAMPAAVQEAIRKAEARMQEIEQRARVSECTHLLGIKLDESGLPPTFRELVAKQFRGKVFEAKELDEAIKDQQDALAKLTESGQVVLPENGRIQVGGLSELDRYELSFLRLVAGPTKFSKIVENEKLIEQFGLTSIQRFNEAKRPALPRALRLSEWYYNLTEDYDAVGVVSQKRLKEANITSSTVASIVKNTVNILLAVDYSQKEMWWEKIVTQEDVDTLDASTLVRTFGISNLSTIAEGDAYTETDWEDEEETASWVKRGNYIGVSLETFLLDKLNVLRTLPTRLANAWYNTISALVSGVFTVNTAAGPVLADTGALFNATAVGTPGGHANLLTAALSYAAFIAARLAMMKQTDQPLGVGRRMGLYPKYLLVPADLVATAEQIRDSELVPTQTSGSGTEFQTANSVRNTFEIIHVPDWTDTNDWALVADPMKFPAIYLIWLRGRRTPELFSADDEKSGALFTNDELRFKVRQYGFRYSATYDCAPVADWRPLHKSNV